MSEKKISELVVDTNVIIQGTPLQDLATTFYSVPEVFAEVRSQRTRDQLASLPFEIIYEAPSEESLKAVVEFSKKTGDYASLSMPDLKVLALTHMLAVRAGGADKISKEPKKARPSGHLPSAPPPKPRQTRKPVEEEEAPAAAQDDGWETAKPKKAARKIRYTTRQCKQDLTEEDSEEEQNGEDEEQKGISVAVAHDAPQGVDNAAERLEELSLQEPKEEGAEVLEEHPQEEDSGEIQVEDSDDDGSEWITPENIKEHRAMEIGVTPEELQAQTKIDVACMTNDFAMQNVLLQMNLNLVSTGGYRVTKIKNWILRCHACFTVTSDMEKKFCPKCGNASLNRVSCSTNSKGEVRYYLKKNFQYNLRGTKYDIPPPQGGRFVNNIVLREDQKEYIKAQHYRQRKNGLNLFDPDWAPLAAKQGDKFLGNNMHGTDTIGFGRRNPNASKRRIHKKK
ncbi:Nin one binding Zn-ribbon like-domain-containing protein [Syncephalastrum racemosum]|uniref:20S-pre-rRNA D-site endonuclease NOB1 n=1 Tax=Syncephalastrum racemosum TaxID=13706 RepID=A0A1X2HCN7_SYNRA|nr:Nin one binding Zn-ribbon like-domain-containing protein [Syncephalastrum racemosum]